MPDPAFQFTTSDRTVRQLSGWFRGTSTNRAAWERAYSGARGRLPTGKPSPLARKAASYLSSGGTVIDLGAGRGADSLWLARQGLSVRAYDYVPSAAQAVQQAAIDEDLDLDVRMLNLNEWRTVLAEGARMARVEGPRVMIARHTADATNRFGRQALARFASMSLRGGGRLFLDVWTGPGRTPDRLKPVPIDEVARDAQRAGCQNPGDQGATGPRGLAALEPRTIGGPMGLKDAAGRLKPKLGLDPSDDDLARRVEALEADVLELRRHNVRLAEIADVVQELLVPLASRDQARIDEAIEKFSKSL